MDLSWLSEPQTWIGFATLLILEVVLGIDNLVFVAILANKVKPSLRDRARITGLSLAVVIRIMMLAFMAKIMTLTQPLFQLYSLDVSGKDLIMLGGGIFLLYKATTELHERLEGANHFQIADNHKKHAAFWGVVAQILILAAVFSVDSGDGGTHCRGNGSGSGSDDRHDFRQQTTHRIRGQTSHSGDVVFGLFADDWF